MLYGSQLSLFLSARQTWASTVSVLLQSGSMHNIWYMCCRTDSDASHHSFSFTAKPKAPSDNPSAQGGSVLSPRSRQGLQREGSRPLSPTPSQSGSVRELPTSAKPRPDSNFAVKVLLLACCFVNRPDSCLACEVGSQPLSSLCVAGP